MSPDLASHRASLGAPVIHISDSNLHRDLPNQGLDNLAFTVDDEYEDVGALGDGEEEREGTDADSVFRHSRPASSLSEGSGRPKAGPQGPVVPGGRRGTGQDSLVVPGMADHGKG